MSTLSDKIDHLDTELSAAVHEQATAGYRANKDIHDAKVAIDALFGRIKEIKTKAEQSELMVAEICKDIKQLDYAKQHLTSTITALRKLNMMVTAVESLKSLTQQRQYGEAADLLSAVKSLLSHFNRYQEVPKILQLKGDVTKIKKQLKDHIIREFRNMSELSAEDANADPNYDAPSNTQLTTACKVVDVLAGSTKGELRRTLIDNQLQPYKKIFGRGKDEAKLGGTERRYNWFRRLLRKFDQTLDGVFPNHWQLLYRMCVEFCEQTKLGLAAEIGSTNAADIDVAVLLRALQKTIQFEKEMGDRFEVSASANGDANSNEGGMLMAPDGSMVDPDSAEGARLKMQKDKEKEQRESGQGSGSGSSTIWGDGEEGSEDGNEKIAVVFKGLISSVFEPAMMSYILLERKNMKQMMDKVVNEDKVKPYTLILRIM